VDISGEDSVRYAGGRPIFLLCELISWTLPQPDTHAAHRLSVATTDKITLNRLAVNRERKNLEDAWRNTLRDAGITDLRFHDLRHTFGTQAVDGGAPVSRLKR